MKATLTIEVPDDYKKGDCNKCSFYGFRKSNTGANPRWCILGCDYDNCPLEIQDDNKWEKVILVPKLKGLQNIPAYYDESQMMYITGYMTAEYIREYYNVEPYTGQDFRNM